MTFTELRRDALGSSDQRNGCNRVEARDRREQRACALFMSHAPLVQARPRRSSGAQMPELPRARDEVGVARRARYCRRMVEYKVRVIEHEDSGELEGACNAMAADGWRLASTTMLDLGSGRFRVYLYFEREGGHREPQDVWRAQHGGHDGG